MLTVWHRDMESISGLMAVCIEEISSKESDTAMVFGKVKMKVLKEIIDSIRNRVWVFTTGRESKCIRDNLEMISGRDMDSIIQ